MSPNNNTVCYRCATPSTVSPATGSTFTPRSFSRTDAPSPLLTSVPVRVTLVETARRPLTPTHAPHRPRRRGGMRLPGILRPARRRLVPHDVSLRDMQVLRHTGEILVRAQVGEGPVPTLR